MDGGTGPAVEHELDDAGVDRALLYIREAPQEPQHPRVVGEDVGAEQRDAALGGRGEQFVDMMVPRPLPCQASWTTKATSTVPGSSVGS